MVFTIPVSQNLCQKCCKWQFYKVSFCLHYRRHKRRAHKGLLQWSEVGEDTLIKLLFSPECVEQLVCQAQAGTGSSAGLVLERHGISHLETPV